MSKKQGDPYKKAGASFSQIVSESISESMAADDLRFKRFWNFQPLEIFRQWFCSRKRIGVIAGSNRSRKTTSALFKAIMVYTGIIPPSMENLYPYKLPTHRPRHVRIIVQDYSKHYAETMRPFLLDDDEWGMLPKAWAQWNNEEHMFTGPDGSFLSIIAIDPKAKVDPNILRGPHIDHTMIDELTRRDAFTESIVRSATLQDGPGTVDFVFCPQEGFDWTYTDLYAKCYNTRTDEKLPEDQQDKDINFQRVSMYDNPSITKEQIERYIGSLKPHEVGYRVYGKYTARGEDPYFDLDLLFRWIRERRIKEPRQFRVDQSDVNTEEGDFKCTFREVAGDQGEDAAVWHVWELPQAKQKYIAVCDTAEGNWNSDFQVCDIWNVTNQFKPHQAAQFRKQRIRPGEFIIEACCAATIYGECLLVYEVNNTSGGVCRDRSRNYCELYKRPSGAGGNLEEVDRLGWYTDQWNKPTGLEEFYRLMKSWPAMEDFCGIRSNATMEELTIYQEVIEKDERGNTKRFLGARRGGHDDCVSPCFMMAYIIRYQYDLISESEIGKEVVVSEKPEKKYNNPLVNSLKKAYSSAESRIFPGLKAKPSMKELLESRKGGTSGRRGG